MGLYDVRRVGKRGLPGRRIGLVRTTNKDVAERFGMARSKAGRVHVSPFRIPKGNKKLYTIWEEHK